MNARPAPKARALRRLDTQGQKRNSDKTPLGEKLITLKLISPDQLTIGLRDQAQAGGRIGETLVKLGFLSSETLTDVLAAEHASVDIKHTAIDPELVAAIPSRLLRQGSVLPYARAGDRIFVAMADPQDVVTLDKLRAHLPQACEPVAMLADARDLADVIAIYTDDPLPASLMLQHLDSGQLVQGGLAEQQQAQPPVVAFIDLLLHEAADAGASDIHFEPEQKFTRVRFRRDGVLHQRLLLHRDHWAAVAQRLKIIASMNIANSGYPEDGRFSFSHANRQVDCRVALLPTVWGENIVIRLLDHRSGLIPLGDLGFSDKQLAAIRTMLKRPHGLMLVTGPTGAGKTTTLYALLQEINTPAINIMTLEEPVEYRLNLIRQTQVRDQQGFTFAAGVRAIMRQDPDVILIGEIRDAETAQMAMRAAMTGHRVLATLHTNDAVGAMPRLAEFGVSPSLLSEQLTGIVAQRLARTLCPACRNRHAASPEECRIMRIDAGITPMVGHAAGCDACDDTGLRGRTVIAEVLRLSGAMRDQLADSATTGRLRMLAKSEGFTSLLTHGIEKVLAGAVTLESLGDVVDLTERM